MGSLITILHEFFTSFKKVDKNELSFLRQYIYIGDYNEDNIWVKNDLSKILQRFRRETFNTNTIFIESKFNNLYYPFFDLDTEENLQLFKELYKDQPYVIFKSSSISQPELYKSPIERDNFWAILDIPYKKLDTIFTNHNWKICNDHKYVEFSKSKKYLAMRGLYEDEKRKPFILEQNGTLSKNLQLFIDKLTKYYSREGLELSVLRYRDPRMLIKFNRKNKLKQINENN